MSYPRREERKMTKLVEDLRLNNEPMLKLAIDQVKSHVADP